MKKWLITVFTIFLIAILVYQKEYLDSLRKNALQMNQQNSDPANTVVSKGSDFKTLFYDKNGKLNAELSGDNITYFEDSTFHANGSLIYKTFDANNKLATTIQTTSAVGIFEQDPQSMFLISGNRQLKSLELPENVSFNFNENRGKTKNVFIDATNRTISSLEHVESNGPNGSFSADGFFYDVDTKNFTFNSKVRGLYKKNMDSKKK